jgi:arabinogalactan endo-1,4-beta-galactosidase
MKKILLIFFIAVTGLCSCGKNDSPPSGNTPPDNPGDTTGTPTPVSIFAKGADISWLTEMEQSGNKFYDRNNVEKDCYQVLKEEGMNAIRLRAWVNPADGWCNTKDVVTKALRAKSAGMRIMIDLHCSDSWADPSQQNKPAAWASLSFTALKNALSDYIKSLMDTLQVNGIYPEWVQVGNETNDGMLWEDGRASADMGNFASLIKAGYAAIKSVFDTTKVIVHLSNGFDNDLYRWMLDGLKNNGAKWDVTGMSLYPSASNWQTQNTQCLANMSDMISRYKTPVMICEVGMPWTDSVACNLFLKDIISKTKSLPGHNGLGVFYWEPESYHQWKGYTLGAFDDKGKPTVALDAFKE